MKKFYTITFIILTLLLTLSITFIINNSEVILGDKATISIKVENKDITIYTGDQYSINPEVTSNSKYTLTYESADKTIATVSKKGVIKGVKAGTVKIKIKNSINTKKITLTVKVVRKPKVFTIDCKELLNVKESYQLNGYLDSKKSTKLTYKTSNSKIATVSETGLVKTLKEGTVTITVKSTTEKKSLTCNMKVEYLPKKITLNETSLSLIEGETFKLTGTISPTNTKYKDIEYISSNNSIAKVDNEGNITTLKPGNVTITAKTFNNVTSELSLTVVEKNQNDIIFLYQKNNVGDVILLSSNNHYALIDTGNPDETSIITNYLKKHNIKTLDFVLITHAHDDHIGGLEKLASKIKIKKLYVKNYNSSKFTKTVPSVYTKGLASVRKNGGSVTYIDSKIKEGKGFTFQDMDIKLYNTTKLNSTGNCPSGTCSGGNDNFNSVMELITVKDKKILLSADFYDKKEYNKYAEKIGKVDVLKLPHHGFNASGSGKDAFKKLNPTYSVVCNTNPSNNKVSFDKPTQNVINSLPKTTQNYYVFDYDYVNFSFKNDQDVILTLGNKR